MELREATANSNLNLNWLLTIWINVQLALLYQACYSSSVVAANHSVYSSNSNSNWNRPQVKVEVRGRARSSSAVQQQPPARVAPSGSGSAPAGAVSQPSSSSAAALYHPNHPNTLLANHLLYRQHEQHKYHSRKMQQQQREYCDIPPDLWCDSYEAALKCDVVLQCDAFRRHAQNNKLKLTLIYEALCPYCQRFIVNHLGALYHQFRPFIELELVPWGNSRILRDGSIKCNHGQVECDANRLQGCVLDHVKIKHALPFIICFERHFGAKLDVDLALSQCSGFIRHHYRAIRRCYENGVGIELQHKAAHRSASVAGHQIKEVPYLLINNYSPNVDANNLNVFAIRHLLMKWFRFYDNFKQHF